MKKIATPKAPQVQFVKMPRDLLRSDAWRAMDITQHRFISFLLHEHLRHGGRENGKLKAPYRQLRQYGLQTRWLANAIKGLEAMGLIDCTRGGQRVATTYAINWLEMPDGTMPAAAWRAFSSPNLRPMPTPKAKNLPYTGKPGLPYTGKPDGGELPYTGKPDGPENLPYTGKSPSRKTSNHAATDSIGEYGNPADPDAVPPARRAAAGGGR